MNRFLKTLFLLLPVFSFIPAFSQIQKGDFSLELGKRMIKFHSGTDSLKIYLDRHNTCLVYARIKPGISKKELQGNGLAIQDYISDHVFSVLLSAQSNITQTGIEAWAEIAPADKISDYVLENLESTPETDILIAVTKETAEAEIRTLLELSGAKPASEQKWKSQHIWEATIPSAKIAQLADRHWVRYINPKLTDIAFNNQAIGYTNSEIAHQPVAIGGYNLSGEGITIGVGDDSDPHHIDYNDRIISFNPRLSSNHGFHTTGTAGGAGLRDERYAGYAPRANLISHFFSGIFAYAPTFMHDFDMHITNNSYGAILGSCSYAGTYDIYSQFLDQQARDNPELMNVFAAGNDAYLTCSPFPPGFATVAGAYQSAKNVLTVGNIGKSILLLSTSTSRGPVKDGRLKPEITAVGQGLISTGFDNGYFSNGGTSMACPNVAGASALLYQRYKQLHGVYPESALIKLLLMNGATDIYIPGPDFRYGFGLMNLGHTLVMMDSVRYFSGILNTGEEQAYTITIPPNTSKAKIMLYWHDADAAPEAPKALVNDLDIKVMTPESSTRLPLVLNPAPALVAQPATEGEDHLNNVEQVTLETPSAGTYTIKVKGNDIPVADQKYYIAYDLVPVGVTVHYPFGGEALASGDSVFIYWEASKSAHTFTVSYSADNGTSWNTLKNDIADTSRFYVWYIPSDIASGECLVKVEKNGTAEQSISKAFTIIGRPVATLAPVAEQCPGSVKFNWSGIANATGYKVFIKEGGEMAEKATVPATQTTYTFRGLPFSEEQWVAVAPVIADKTGMRSVAINRIPGDGSCTGIGVSGDLAISQIIKPLQGRENTSLQLDAAEILTVRVRNLDAVAATSYKVSYQLNDAPWQSQTYSAGIAPVASLNVNLVSVPMDLSATGIYNLKVAVTNLAIADPVNSNDTVVITLKNLPNPPIDLDSDYIEEFEGVGINKTGPEFGIDGADRWDFLQSNKGRIRGFVNSDIIISGNRSLSLDNSVNQRYSLAASSLNTITGTFNLTGYDISGIELRCEFDYRLHGVPKFDTANEVWIRGKDTDPWIAAFRYDTTGIGAVRHSGSVSFNDLLLANGQTFSSSTQVRIGQYDTSLISAPDYGNGLTFDNFKIYRVTNDVELLSIDSLFRQSCALSSNTPLKIRVRNTVFYTLHNISVSYKLDDGPVVIEMIDSIRGKDTAFYTFSSLMDLSGLGEHTLSVWVHMEGDSYTGNDSILELPVHNQPLITSYPYLQDFEAGNGYFYTGGTNSSWEYGTPTASAINHAASGSKAWKTNIDGIYNSMETSFLYSPCFDISGLTKPVLSFSLASDIESRSESLFDLAYVEYSNDGENWQRLGKRGEGYNWYNDTADVWARNGETYWHVATIPLPASDIIMIRFVMNSDPGSEFEGIAIDDIHIYDRQYPLFNAAAPSSPVTKNVAAASSADFTISGKIAASINNPGSSLGDVAVQAYKHSNYVLPDSTQYILPKSFTVNPANTPGEPVTLQLFVPDEAVKTLRENASCLSCPTVREVYQLGITKYSNNDQSLENGKLEDNNGGSYSYIKRSDVRWVPYDIGYYAEAMTSSFSEFWFNDGGPTGTLGIDQKAVELNAARNEARSVLLDWTSYIDTAVLQYELESAGSDLAFSQIYTMTAVNTAPQMYMHTDNPRIDGPYSYYRLHYQLKNGTWFYSNTCRINWDGAAGNIIVYPNPVSNGLLTIDWLKGNDAPLSWSMHDISGRVVTSGKIEHDPYAGSFTINMNDLGIAAGIYMLKIRNGRTSWKFKIVYQ